MKNTFYAVPLSKGSDGRISIIEKPLHMVEKISDTESHHSCILESDIDRILNNPSRNVRIKRSTEVLARVLQSADLSFGGVETTIGCICKTKKGKVIFLFDYDIENVFFKYDQEFFHFMLAEIQKYTPLPE